MKLSRSFGLALSLAIIGCGPSFHESARTPDITTVRVYRELNAVMHADSSYDASTRAALDRAATRLQVFTSGRARIRIVYDLDFWSYAGLLDHVSKHHWTMFSVRSGGSVAGQIDARHPRQVVLAETAHLEDSVRVVFVSDRFEPDQLEIIATHELGHVIGFDDLPVFGAIMSGAQRRGDPMPTDFTVDDLLHCRLKRYCD